MSLKEVPHELQRNIVIPAFCSSPLIDTADELVAAGVDSDEGTKADKLGLV